MRAYQAVEAGMEVVAISKEEVNVLYKSLLFLLSIVLQITLGRQSAVIALLGIMSGDDELRSRK